MQLPILLGRIHHETEYVKSFEELFSFSGRYPQFKDVTLDWEDSPLESQAARGMVMKWPMNKVKSSL